jgi:hypothetical protein
MATTILGIDLGAHSVKVCGRNGTFAFPAAVMPYAITGDSDLGQVASSLAFSFDDSVHRGDYNIGELALLTRNVVRTVTNTTRLSGSETTALYLAAVSMACPNEQDINAFVVAGLPARLATPSNLETLKNGVGGRYTLRHHNGRLQNIQLSIEHVMSQPNGGLLDFFTDPDGFPVNEATFRDEIVAVLDVGGETSDFAYFMPRLTWVADKSGSIDLGTRWMEDNVLRDIEQFHGVRGIDPYSIWKQIHERKVTVRGKKVDINVIVEKRLRELASLLCRFSLDAANTNLNELQLFLCTGGGELDLFEYIQAQFPHAQIGNDPRFANARGFYKKALRLARQKNVMPA